MERGPYKERRAPKKEELRNHKPSKKRRERGPVAIVERFQEIPCDPCHSSCIQNAIKPFQDINDLPEIDVERCNGCETCISYCPGLAIFVVDETYSQERAIIRFPWEFIPIPPKGSLVMGIDREGRDIGQVRIHQAEPSPRKDGSVILWLDAPKEKAYEVKSIQLERSGEQWRRRPLSVGAKILP